MTGIADLEAFAWAQGWILGEVGVDDDPARPLLAWSSLMVVARGQSLAAVLVPDVDGLRPPPLVLEHLRTRCAREIGAPLLLAPPAAAPEPHHPSPSPPSTSSFPAARPRAARRQR